MTGEQHRLRLIQSHKALEHFDYSEAVNWAIDLIRQGNETDNVLMLASFSEPIDRIEISPYVTNVLNGLGLEELDYEDAVIAKTHFHLIEIINDKEVRENLRSLNQLCVDNGYESDLMSFYILNHAWDELAELGVNFYLEKSDLGNIESELKIEAEKWIDKYINGNCDTETKQSKTGEADKTLFWTSALNMQTDSSVSIGNTLRKLWSRLTDNWR